MTHPFAGFNALYEAGLEASRMPESALRRPRFYNMWQLFALSRGIVGETAEVGCFRGLSSYLMCHARRDEDPAFKGRGHRIVDSFEGLSPPTQEDRLGGEFAGRFGDTSVEHVRETLREFPEVEINKGWVPEVFETLPEATYRFVHIDVDLYNPTRDSLDYFYPRLALGGLIVVDDFTPWPAGGKYVGCPRAVMEYCGANGLTFAALETGNAVLVKR